ncbi:MAG TPA: uracil-DNA glycosylase, partial [Flavobacterium sp.]|nr:uracil-DNA glycosylase [Flavobacterium sp.]
EISNQTQGVVFLLWGGFAKKKGARIDRNKHLVLESGHPSPLSANKGHWFGNKHFSKTNEYLVSKGENAIDW